MWRFDRVEQNEDASMNLRDGNDSVCGQKQMEQMLQH